MKVFVTGGAGFIGSHVVPAIIDAGNEVTVFDDLSSGYREYVDSRARFVHADIANNQVLVESMQGHDAVVHLASENNISDSLVRPAWCLKRNVDNAVDILEAMRFLGIKKIVFSSSAAVYGVKGNEPISEEDEKQPFQPYGASKLAVESILSGYHFSFGMACVAFRFFNVYGPRDDQLPITRAIPLWCKSIMLGKEIPLYWGGKQIRDYIFVGDVARAIVLALEKCSGLCIYNLGSGKSIPMIEIAEALFLAAGKRVPIKMAGERKGDPPLLVCDISKIKQELGWSPEMNLSDGLKITFEFYKTHKESLQRM